jgi:hypothetical protein
MEIADAKRREVDEGVVQIGDMVLSEPTDEMLPTAMTIGKITAIRPDYENPLLSILTVTSAVHETELRRVYIFDPSDETLDRQVGP